MKISFKKLVFLVLLFSFAGSVQAQPDFRQLQDHMHAHIQEGNVLGMAVAYIYPDGRTQYITRGALTSSRDQSVAENTIFEIGSISKTFTALIMMQMAEEGAFSLDTSIDMILPDSLNLPSYEGKKITLRHLATHTSGLPRLPANLNPADPYNPYADYTTQQMYEFIDGYDLTAEPGTNYAYSNLGMGLLGHLLELKSGKSYEALLREYITDPLNMEDTEITVSSVKQRRFSDPYNFGNEVTYWDLPTLAGAGAIRSTAEDMAAYVKAQSGLMESPLESAIQSTQTIQFDIGSGNQDAIGLGWFFSTGQDTILWHGGGTGGFRTFAGFNKETGAGAVVLASGTQDISDIGLYLLDQNHQLAEVKEMVTVEPVRLESYTGTYKSAVGISFYVTREDDQLFVQLSGQGTNPVFAKSPTRFYYKVVNAEIEFYPAEGDAPASLTLYQNGQEIKADKTSDEIEKTTRKEAEVDPAILDRYTGVYQINPMVSMTITREGNQLNAQLTGQPQFAIYPESETKFFLKVVDAEIEFFANEEGAYNSLKLYQGGRTMEGQRKEEE